MIIFMGVAGAGKSVQGKLLAEKLNYTWISTGELLRNSLSSDRSIEMLEGKLLDDKEIIDVVNEHFVSHDISRCILDGFPRTLVQAQWLLNNANDQQEVEAVIHLTADKAVVKKRLIERGRPDDNEEAIDRRFQEYETHTVPIASLFLKNSIVVHEIDGDKPIEEVHKQIFNNLRIN